MEAWTEPLTDFGVLLSCSSLITLGAIFAVGKPSTPLAILGEALKNGAIGAGVGICVIDRVGARIALGIASATGAGLLSKDFLQKLVAQRFGVNDAGKPPKSES